MQCCILSWGMWGSMSIIDLFLEGRGDFFVSGSVVDVTLFACERFFLVGELFWGVPLYFGILWGEYGM